ncbi:hybrid sensor histidine kinase/response regulator [Glaciecola sp. KUL10]|uniref:hybrid sensor histidine kinase/response regulator n=1 Tax=Glaciecola sp. (strain KUL10) TaxID=2161813 RepID=UPI001F445DF3|nr:hybrid sensor histidine kinase/response regulator [Glaciecola sp. KUL10]
MSILLRLFIKFLLFVSLQLSFEANARVFLENDTGRIEISDAMQIYTLNEELSIELFKARQPRLSYQEYEYPNIGFQDNSVWMFTRLENKSDLTRWFINVNFTQLPHVDAYLFKGDELVYFRQGGNKDNQEHYRLPTFELSIETNTVYSLYIRVKAERIPIIAPIFISDASTHAYMVSFDSMIWGAFYGGLFILALYAVSVVYSKQELSALLLFFQVCLVTLWQFVWSGHAQLLPLSLKALPMFHNMDFLVPFVSAASTLFIVFFFKDKLSQRYHHPLFIGFFVVLFLCVIAVATNQFEGEHLALLSRFVGFITIFLNVYLCAVGVKGRYKPAYPIVFGVTVLLVCSILSSLFIAGYLPPTTPNTYLFQISLVILTCSFAFALNIKLRYILEIEVQEASRDAENNFLLIEEQNVHLDIARKEALRASEVKSQFLANMSHEIRTPLNAIIGFSKEVEENHNQTEREEHIRIINSAASDLLTIVNDILDFSKMEAGKLNVANKPFSAYAIFEEAASQVAKSAHLKQLQFILDIQPLPASLIGDQFKIKQLLSNLLSNALKFTNFGTITLKAGYDWLNHDEINLNIEIKDTGIGISEQDQLQLFTPFSQLNDELNRSFQGTGLGLVICQQLTYLMNGNIQVKSESGKGSLFKLQLPLKVLEQRLTPEKMPFWLTKTACIFDPNPITRAVTMRLLRSIGINTYSFDKLDVLLGQDYEFDLAFITLPMEDVVNRTATINKSYAIKADQFVLVYSGPSPETHQYNRSDQEPVLLRLPITTKKLEDIYATPNQVSDVSSKTKFNKLPNIKLLAVDDMFINLKLLQTWLKNSPVQLYTADSGQKAVELCQESEFDIILMDIQMPNMDGVQATGLIRKTSLNQGTPIVAITAHAFQEEKKHFLDSGMDDYLPKPIDINKLVALINEWCPADTFEPVSKKSINWELSIKRSYGNQQAAFEYLEEFVEELPTHVKQLEALWQQQDITELKVQIHKLHGASCYTGVSDLQKKCNEVEGLLKTNRLQDIAKPMSSLLLEIEAVIKDWAQVRNQVQNTLQNEN